MHSLPMVQWHNVAASMKRVPSYLKESLASTQPTSVIILGLCLTRSLPSGPGNAESAPLLARLILILINYISLDHYQAEKSGSEERSVPRSGTEHRS